MRDDLVMSEQLKSFLEFDLGTMDPHKYQPNFLDIPYTHQGNKLDVYLPEHPANEDKKYPVFLIVYGGGFCSGKKQSKFVDMMLKPLKHGYACVVAEYTLSLDDIFPRPIQDLKNAIGWIRTKGKDYHLDGSDLTIWGESAGGYLVLATSLMPDHEFELDYDVDCKVDKVVCFYPAVDVDNFHNDSSFVFEVFLGKNANDPETRRRSNPTHYIREEMPALWIQHGTADTLVPYTQSQAFVEAVRAKAPNTKLHYELAEGKTHTDAYFFTDENVARFIEFFEKE